MTFIDYEKNYADLAKSYNALKIASDVDSSSSVSGPVSISENLVEQRRRPAQRIRIDFAKTQPVVSATMLADRLRSVQKPSELILRHFHLVCTRMFFALLLLLLLFLCLVLLCPQNRNKGKRCVCRKSEKKRKTKWRIEITHKKEWNNFLQTSIWFYL